MPVLKARKALKEMPPGEILEVLATDPGAVQDFAAFCETTGCELLESAESDGVYSFRLKKPE
jgi:tRNA 2-thiouridine synthesizing protein A